MKKTITGFLRIAMALVTMTASQATETDAVRHIGGLPGVKPRAVGRLMATEKGIAFEEGGATTFVDAAQIVKVSTDDERYMKGGAFGQVVRTGVPFAGGLGIGLSGLSQSFGSVPFVFGFLASAFTQSRADVVTVEYFDPHDGYHGAVFMMPWHAAEEIKQQVSASGVQPNVDPAKNACSAMTTFPHLMTMLPVSSQGAEVPDEYRVLTYEHVFSALQRKASGWQVRRFGDSHDLASCEEWKLALTVEAFRKGNAAERALMGPLGQFVGTTSLSCRVVLSNGHGDSLLDEKLKAVIRGDRESLDLGDEISKLISRKIRKVLAQS
jgi:hypothetical protein